MKLFIILFCIVIQWMFKIVVGFDFNVQVLPTEYSWKVKVTSEALHVTEHEQIITSNGQSNYITFELDKKKRVGGAKIAQTQL
uniref:Uncharacterized protein n=1 Tax=Meloidogyne enterolobii TaxID=390850 RepID=A0A6V7VX61_MELEN|nr:unnamed protein product [Meloidogyne enterolobii]